MSLEAVPPTEAACQVGASSSVAAGPNHGVQAAGPPAMPSKGPDVAGKRARMMVPPTEAASQGVGPLRGAAPSAGSHRAELRLPDYFERQQAGYARCGLHALNNALGAQLITAEDMSTACTEYLAEMQFEG